jgi:hypothetical protein
MEALARHFSATVSKGTGLTRAGLRIRGKRIAVQVAAVRLHAVRRPGVIGPRLRCDRVALALVSRLRTAIEGSVPAGVTVIATITAPIRLAARTAVAIEDRVRPLLAGRPAGARLAARIHGNHVRIRIVRGGTKTTSKLVGFVHNPDVDPGALFELTRALLLATGSGKPRTAGGGEEHWLVVVSRSGLLPIGTYRNVCEQLGLHTVFTRILLALPDGGIETLTG